jgi:4'-phosphopantetheinyl transferase
MRSYLSTAVAILSSAELSQARGHGPRQRERFQLGRGALRILLASYVGEDAENLRISPANLGGGLHLKPRLVSAHPVAFSVSYSDDLVLYGVGRTPLGVDIEAIRGCTALMPLACYALTDGERDFLARTNPSDRRTGFLRGWTRKEAFAKATGRGLFLEPRTIEVTLGREEPELLAVPGRFGRRSDWAIADVSPDPHHVAAAVAQDPTTEFTRMGWIPWSQ